MKVPKYIREAIIKNAKANEIAGQTDAIIRDWLEKKKIYNDSVIDAYVDSCNMGNDPEGFIKFLENDLFGKGNDNRY